MKAIQQQLVHESETQRQHIRLKMPSRVEMQGRLYPVRDLSPAGLGVEGAPEAMPEAAEVPIRLVLPFEGFSLDVELTGRVRHYNSGNKVLGLQFVNLSPERVAVLTYVVKAYIAGDVIEAGDVLSVTARDNFVKMRKKKEEAAQDTSLIGRMRRYTGTVVICLFGAAVAAFIAFGVYEKLFLIKSTDGVVQGNVVNIRMPENGTYASLLEKDVLRVKAGQQLASITAPAVGQEKEQTMMLTSPCDCLVVPGLSAASGEYKDRGERLMVLIPDTTKPWISASIPMEDIHRLQINDVATVRIAGTDLELQGRVTGIGSNIGPFEAALSTTQPSAPVLPVATVTIEPLQLIQVEYIGRPAYVEFSL